MTNQKNTLRNQWQIFGNPTCGLSLLVILDSLLPETTLSSSLSASDLLDNNKTFAELTRLSF